MADDITITINHDTGEVNATQPELEYWTKVVKAVPGGVNSTCCCCKAPGASRKECMAAAGNKTPCRCACHSTKPLRGGSFTPATPGAVR